YNQAIINTILMFSIYLISVIFIIGGAFHFIKPKIYLRVMPLYLPYRLFLIYLSGGLEILAGLLFYFHNTRLFGGYLIIGLLSIFLIVHVNMLRGGKHAAGLPMWILVIRLLLQFIFIYWITYLI
ncbi:MAG: DoxX family protein, partial [Psychroflexus salarius]